MLIRATIFSKPLKMAATPATGSRSRPSSRPGAPRRGRPARMPRHQRGRRVSRLGLRRLRRRSGRQRGASRHRQRPAADAGVRRQRRAGVEGRARVRRHHPCVRRKGGPVKAETLAELNAERAARRPALVVTDMAGGEQRLVKAKDIAADPLGAESGPRPGWRRRCRGTPGADRGRNHARPRRCEPRTRPRYRRAAGSRPLAARYLRRRAAAAPDPPASAALRNVAGNRHADRG